MTATLLEMISGAEDRGENPEIALFSAIADTATVRAARVLSVAIAVPEHVLRNLIVRLWSSENDADNGLVGLRLWPMLQEGPNGWWRMAASFRKQVAEEFLASEPGIFRDLHTALIEAELDNNAEEESWFVKTRIAYYLCGIDSSQAVSEFAASFSTPPVFERTSCRLWLAGLALQQDYLLKGHERELRFLSGFTAYTQGDRRQARRDFQFVIAGRGQDYFRAVSLHLLGSMERRDHPETALQFIDESIALSHELGVTENEIMARNTSVWTLCDAVKDQGQGLEESLRQAQDRARLNLKQADALGDPSLTLWTRRSDAVVEWLLLSGGRRSVQSVSLGRAGEIARTLLDVSLEGLELGELETAVYAANDAACILRDVGQMSEALSVVEHTIDAISWIRGTFPPLDNLGKTTGAIIQRARDSSVRNRAVGILERLDQLKAGR
jgi:hypothetical protein